MSNGIGRRPSPLPLPEVVTSSLAYPKRSAHGKQRRASTGVLNQHRFDPAAGGERIGSENQPYGISRRRGD